MHAMIPTHTQTIHINTCGIIYGLYNIKYTENAPFIPTYARCTPHTPAVRNYVCVCVCKWLLSVGFVQGSLWIQHIYSGSLARATQFPFQTFVYTQREIHCAVAKDSSSEYTVHLNMCVLLLLCEFHSQLLTPSTHFAAKSACIPCYEGSSCVFCSFS